MTVRLRLFGLVAVLAATTSVYLAAQQPQGRGGGAGQTQPAGPAPGRQGNAPLGAGPLDTPPVDAAAADRGRTVWAAECITCHGTQARGADGGPNLIRSLVILKDRFGSVLGPFLKKGHPMQSGRPSTTLTEAQVPDLAHFLRQRVMETLRGSPIFVVQNVLTGDAAAGAAYFNGPGKCATCHTATALSLAGFGGRYPPVDVQQRFLFPGGRGGRGAAPNAAPNPSAITVTVTPASGPAVSGVLLQMDDFTVTLREAAGTTRTFTRTPSVKVVKTDPLAAHRALLESITDKQMHDMVAYLVTLK